jgi:hypothetical protein
MFYRAPPRLDWSPTPQWWENESGPCPAHDHERLRPEVVAVPPLAAPAASAHTPNTVVYPEAQVRQIVDTYSTIKIYNGFGTYLIKPKPTQVKRIFFLFVFVLRNSVAAKFLHTKSIFF